MRQTGIAEDDITEVAIELLRVCNDPFHPHKFIGQLERSIEDLQAVAYVLSHEYKFPRSVGKRRKAQPVPSAADTERDTWVNG
ncbi:hypothetical protein E2P64_06835 [Candidatus Bathyarchaeota archaeon]|nr:hypothetical protein E2P64_06835 [Candidatus Bathyarchaeota archaeon]